VEVVLDHDDFQVDYSVGFDENPAEALESVVADQDDEAALVDNAQNFVMIVVDAALESVDDFPNAAGSAALNDFQELKD